MIAHPDYTFTVTPPGGSATDYTQYLAWAGTSNQMTITQNFGRQGDTAVFVLVDEYVTTPTFHIPVFSQVKLTDNTLNLVLFAGVCNDPVLDVTSPNRNEWNLQCTDYTFYADNKIVHGTFVGQTVDSIVVALTQQANCGITAKKISQGGFVAPGPQLATFSQNYDTLSSVWRTLSQLAGQVTPYGWYVDENRHLHFYDATTAINSGVTFTTSPTAVNGSATEGHLYVGNNFGYEWDGTSVRNRILVQGATQTISHGNVNTTAATDTWKGNGAQTSWPLRYTITGTPTLKISGRTTAVTVVDAGSTGTGTWQIGQNSVGAWFLNNTVSAPADGVVIKLWYDYQVPVIAQANDFASQQTYAGPNGGIFEEYINDTTLTTVPMALSRAMRERQEYAFAAERITFTTTEDWSGWVRSGETCTIVNQFIPDSQNNYVPGINDQFIVISNTVVFGDGGYKQSEITGIRL